MSTLVTVSKLFSHDMRACQWEKEFMTRLSMRMKWGESPTGIRIETGLWECEARNNPGNRRFGCFDTRTSGFQRHSQISFPAAPCAYQAGPAVTSTKITYVSGTLHTGQVPYLTIDMAPIRLRHRIHRTTTISAIIRYAVPSNSFAARFISSYSTGRIGSPMNSFL